MTPPDSRRRLPPGENAHFKSKALVHRKVAQVDKLFPVECDESEDAAVVGEVDGKQIAG